MLRRREVGENTDCRTISFAHDDEQVERLRRNIRWASRKPEDIAGGNVLLRRGSLDYGQHLRVDGGLTSH